MEVVNKVFEHTYTGKGERWSGENIKAVLKCIQNNN